MDVFDHLCIMPWEARAMDENQGNGSAVSYSIEPVRFIGGGIDCYALVHDQSGYERRYQHYEDAQRAQDTMLDLWEDYQGKQ